MLRLALRGIAANKLRAALTSLAILLGVAMIAGTLILTDSVNRAFDDIFADANEGVDVSVRAPEAVEASFEIPISGAALPEELVEEVAAVEGAASVSGSIGDGGAIAILDAEGERIGPPEGGPPHIATSTEPEPFTPFTYVEGGAPSVDEEVVIDSITAGEEGYSIGDEIPITGAEGLTRYTVSGIGRFGSGVPLAGASIAEFTLAEAQRITGKEGELDQIAVEAAEGLSPEELRDRIVAAIGPETALVRTGDETASDDAEQLTDGFGFLTTALLVFAGITVFVGGFLIFNTFSITVAQRTREFGMLRTLGASSRQLLVAVLVEALVLGLIASLLGIAAGIGFVKLVLALFEAVGFELPQAGLPLSGRTIAVGLTVGLLSTAFSALVPALRATRVTPMEAVAEAGEKPAAAHGRGRVFATAALTLLGVALIVGGLFSGGGFGAALALIGAGLILLFIGIAMLGGRIVVPLASLIGRPIERLRGVTGRLARENTLRNPGRTATTSAALMIGVALVVFVLVLGSAITKSVGEALDRTFTGDLAILHVDGFSQIPAGIAPAVGAIDGVAVASPLAAAGGRLADAPESEAEFINGWDPATLREVASIDWVDGSDEVLAGLSPDGAILEEDWAEENDLALGDRFRLVTPAGREIDAVVEGIARDRVSLLLDSLALPRERLREDFDLRQDQFVLASFEEGVDVDAVRAEVDELIATSFPQVQARSQQQLKDDQEQQINTLVSMIYALLALAVLLSLIGVVNTLVLTVLERKRELGMLRAIGASRSQVRRMIRYESLITALIGAVIGAVIGVGVGVATVKALESEGLVLSVPVGGLIAVLVLAGVAGVVAGIWPARRASRIEVMEALQYE